jgi:hypothetical protein
VDCGDGDQRRGSTRGRPKRPSRIFWTRQHIPASGLEECRAMARHLLNMFVGLWESHVLSWPIAKRRSCLATASCAGRWPAQPRCRAIFKSHRVSIALLVLALCLLISVCALSAQQSTVNHGVSLRADPSTKSPPIGHLPLTIPPVGTHVRVVARMCKTRTTLSGWRFIRLPASRRFGRQEVVCAPA